jgi:glycerophosphoryl diester phosphodiesterase
MKELDVNEKLPFLVIGHRGCVDGAPENTLMSVRRAIELGCKMVEVDVYVVDGVLVVHHDETIDRTSNGKGKLDGHTFESLRELEFGEGEVIPTLEEVLDLCLNRVEVNIELKGPGTAAPVVSMLQRRELIDRVIISSFEWQQLREVRDLSGTSIAVLVRHSRRFLDALDIAGELGAGWVNLSIKILAPSRVEKAHECGLSVAVYTVKSVGDLEKVLCSGADACFADNPEMVIGFLCDM